MKVRRTKTKYLCANKQEVRCPTVTMESHKCLWWRNLNIFTLQYKQMEGVQEK